MLIHNVETRSKTSLNIDTRGVPVLRLRVKILLCTYLYAQQCMVCGVRAQQMAGSPLRGGCTQARMLCERRMALIATMDAPYRGNPPIRVSRD